MQKARAAFLRQVGPPEGVTVEEMESILPLALEGAKLEDAKRARKRKERQTMKETASESGATAGSTEVLLALRRDREAEAARQRARPREVYIAALSRRAGAPVLEVLAAERRELASAQKLRPQFVAVLARHPEPSREDPPQVAELLRGLRGPVEAALTLLERGPGEVETLRARIEAVPPDCGSPEALAAQHWLSIWPALGRARPLAGVLEAIPALEAQLTALAAEYGRLGRPVERPGGAGPLLDRPPDARRSYRARTEVNHE